MFFISPKNSFPVLQNFLLVKSFKSHPSQRFHPQTPKLSFGTINFIASEPPILRTYQQNNDIFCSSSPIALLNRLNVMFEAICNKTEYNKKFEEENTAEKAAEFDNNRAFLKKDFDLKLSESETISSDSNNFKDAKFPVA